MTGMQQKMVMLKNGIELAVVDEGPRDAPALIFLHGFPESHRTWRHQIRHFSDRYRCIAPDQRGYGRSAKPDGVEAYTANNMIGDVFRLADALGIDDFTVVGHDWGGAIAWGVALTGQKTRVRRAIVANAPHPGVFPKLVWTDKAQRQASQYFRDFRDSLNDAALDKGGLKPLLGQQTTQLFSDKMEPEERAALEADWADPKTAKAMVNWYRASPVFVPPIDAPYELPADYKPLNVPVLEIPTLVVWAMDDPALSPANVDGLAETIPDLTVERVYDCGHFVTWEAADRFIAAMEEFLARTEAAT
ncbi:alpha/beta fold hydrolase [Novosphingobium huizhouense]|uniref:alpha/beta fold hydrolase n=1 Tax=Novosphingobium huizhouense TaxID=2866625 RepID=UPI001CD848AB|nr:alpha/beta hydrolase [Novosphingobium huizhouense]